MAVSEFPQHSRVATQFEAGLFKAVMDSSPHAIAVWDGDAPLYTNTAWDALMGSETPDDPDSKRELVTSSRTFDYCGTRLTVMLKHDVTERKKTERQLIEAQKLEALGRWVGGVVHDFNNLLTAVMLYSDLVDHSAEQGSAAARYNEEIRSVAKRGAGLTGQLLSFLQQRPYEPVVISINSLLKGLRELLERMMGEDIALVLDLGSGSCNVNIDPSQMQQIVFNVALNARDAMSSGGTLTIRTSETEADLGRGVEKAVSLEISDTGCGMDSPTCARVFEPFFTTKPAGKGTGLGLTIVQKIATDASAVVRVTSKVAMGTTVAVDFPRSDPAIVQEISSSQAKDLPRGNETVLIVEDDLASRTSIATFLTHCGYNVLQAANGDDALGLSREFPSKIHLLITDVVLPGFSGRDLARRLTSSRPQTRVLFMSGYSIPDSTGTDIIFNKPFNSEALAFRVRQALAEPGQSDPVGR